MNPAQRIKVIKRIGDLMGPSDWADIDLTLRQFNLQWSDTWGNDDHRQYVIAMIEKADDSALVELLSFLQNEQGESLLAEEKALPWASGYFRLFGSHITADKVLTSQLKRHLLLWGVDLFVAHQDIKPSTRWVREIELALRASRTISLPNRPE